MPTGIFIPADDSIEPTVREFSTLSDYQNAIGGYIEVVDLVEPDFAASTIIINEEGKFLPEPNNRRATLLLWMHQPALRFEDEVVGDAILLGSTNAHGDLADVPDRMKQLLLHTTRFVIEIVKSNSDSTKRVHRVGPFRSWVNAYIVGVDIMAIMTVGTEVRVVPE